jgi:hypothetical protein
VKWNGDLSYANTYIFSYVWKKNKGKGWVHASMVLMQCQHSWESEGENTTPRDDNWDVYVYWFPWSLATLP